jgi:esterase
MELFYRKIGENGPALLIMHGVFGMSDNWLGIAKVLAEKYTVYLLDLQNHGQSPHSNELSYSSMATDLAQFIESHQLVKPYIVGHSMGGKVLMTFADAYPNIAQKIAIIDIAPRFYPVHHHMLLQGLNTIDIVNLESRTQANEYMKRFEDSEGVRQFLLKNLYRPETGGFGWRFNLKILTEQIANVSEEVYPKTCIETETLFMYGENSSYITETDIQEIEQHYSHVSFKKIANAGHWVQADQPLAFTECLLEFLEK